MGNIVAAKRFNQSIDIYPLAFPYYSDYIDSINLYEFRTNEASLFLPEGVFEIILQLGNTFFSKPTNEELWTVRPSSFLGGLHTQSYMVKPKRENQKVLGIKFKPRGTKYFIQKDLREFKDSLISLDEIFKNESIAALDKLDQNSTNSIIRVQIKYFLDCNFQKLGESEIDQAIEMMHHNKGVCNISSLAAKFDLSSSQFRNRFNKEVGVSPKTYAKILRINSAHSLICDNRNINFTQIAYELGYYDQAHFIKEFKSLARVSPSQYYQQQFGV